MNSIKSILIFTFILAIYAHTGHSKDWPLCSSECKFVHQKVFQTKEHMVGLNVIQVDPLHDEKNHSNSLIAPLSDGRAFIWPKAGDFAEFPRRICLAPIQHHDKLSGSHALCAMSISSIAPNQPLQGHRYVFDYAVRDERDPKVAYSNSISGKKVCQIFPGNIPRHNSIQHSPHISSVSNHGDIIWMWDSDDNAILAQVGTTRRDCGRLLASRRFPRRNLITSMTACQNGVFVFVGFSTGEISLFKIKDRETCKSCIVRVKTIAPRCNCECTPPIPVKLELCCGDSEGCRLLKYELYVIYKKVHHENCDCDCFSGNTFLTRFSIKAPADGDYVTAISKPAIIQSMGSELEFIDMKVCCCTNQVVVLVRRIRECDDHWMGEYYGAEFLASWKYNEKSNTFTFIARAALPNRPGVCLKAWTQYCEKERHDHSEKKREKCCLFLLYEVNQCCVKDKCHPCPPKSVILSYCLECKKPVKCETTKHEK